MDKLKIIKIVVVFMTFILVLGSLLLLTSVYKKVNKKTPQMLENISLNQPAESRINNILEHNDYIYILVKDGGQADRIIIFNPKEGKKVSTISIY